MSIVSKWRGNIQYLCFLDRGVPRSCKHARSLATVQKKTNTESKYMDHPFINNFDYHLPLIGVWGIRTSTNSSRVLPQLD